MVVLLNKRIYKGFKTGVKISEPGIKTKNVNFSCCRRFLDSLFLTLDSYKRAFPPLLIATSSN